MYVWCGWYGWETPTERNAVHSVYHSIYRHQLCWNVCAEFRMVGYQRLHIEVLPWVKLHVGQRVDDKQVISMIIGISMGVPNYKQDNHIT